jgi:RHH-type rel operon transcriptional repressor/antitoxin RelB
LQKEDVLMLTIRLPEKMEARLNVLADATKRPKSFYVREALERSLEDIEDVYLAEAALERFRASGEKAIPLEELERRLGLAD